MRPKKFSQTGTFVLRNVGAKGLTVISVKTVTEIDIYSTDMVSINMFNENVAGLTQS